MSSDKTHEKKSETEMHNSTSEEMSSTDVVKEIVSELGDHREFTVFQTKLFELPVIIYDQENGFDFYSGIHQMEESGKYLYHHHKIVKAESGDPAIESHKEGDLSVTEELHQEQDSTPHQYDTPTLDLSITNFVAFQMIAAIIVIFLFTKAKAGYKKRPGKAPKGIQNLVETFVLFVRDDIVRPNIPVRKIANSLTPYFITLFFFVYMMNMVGLLPGGHTPTSSISITAGLALTAFFVINIFQIKQEGLGGYLKHLTAGSPWFIWIIMIPIEVAGIIIKPAVLAIRLFANMSAGHIVLFSFIGLIVAGGLSGTPYSIMALFVYILEFLVAFIQAYIFTMLTAIFLGLGLHDENEQHAH